MRGEGNFKKIYTQRAVSIWSRLLALLNQEAVSFCKKTQAFVLEKFVWSQASYFTSQSLLSVICKFGNNNGYPAGLFFYYYCI